MSEHDRPEWDGVERRLATSAEVVRWYKRERLKTVAYSVITTLVLTTVLSFVIGHKLSVVAHDNATRNCQVQAGARPSGNARALAIQQVLRIADQAFRQFPPQFQDAENSRINAELYKARELIPGFPTRVNGFSGLRALIDTLPLIDCANTIQ